MIVTICNGKNFVLNTAEPVATIRRYLKPLQTMVVAAGGLLQKQALRWLCVFMFAGFTAAWGTPIITFNGSFHSDNEVQLFDFSTASTAVVTVRTTSFADGGFAPWLSLFDSTGTLIFFDNGLADNDCANNTIDSLGTGTCYDARISWTATAGELYTVALTQYDNYAIGPNLADGFNQRVNNPDVPNFTAAPPFNSPGFGTSFLLPSYTVPGDQRGGNWAITFESPDQLGVVQLPEPSTPVLFLTGLALAACGLKRFGAQRN